MNTAAQLAAYGGVLALVAVSAWTAGTVLGPVAGTPALSGGAGHGGASEGGGHGGSGHGAGTVAGAQPAGLSVSRDGYTLTPTDTTLTAGESSSLGFRITGPNAAVVTKFDVQHDKRLHLIVVRRDTADFQHLHPTMAPDGTWTTSLVPATAGSYRFFADFKATGGPATTLGADFSAAGDFEPSTYEPTRKAEVDGYEVRLDGDLVPGSSSQLRLTVSKDDAPVTDLQPYLAAYGHLVALRQSDLAYLHVHPEGTPGDGKTLAGPDIVFAAEVPSAGRYRLFLDFQHEGKVHTAEFTVDTATAPAGKGQQHHGH
jgi:hypothetical protein